MIKNIIAYLLISSCSCLVSSAQVNIDSLKSIWKNTSRHDTIRLNAINQMVNEGYLYSKPDSAFYYAQLQYDFAKSKGLKKQMANARNMQGISLMYQGKYDLANDHYTQSLSIHEEISNKAGIANTLNGIGNNFRDQGDFNNALKCYNRSLRIREEIGDKKGISASLNNIGVVYYKRGDYTKALDYHNRSLAIKKEMGNKKGMAYSFINMGINYFEQGDYVNAIDYYRRGFSLVEEIGDKRAMSSTLNNIALIYTNQSDFENALKYHNQSLAIAEEMSDKKGIIGSLNNIGLIYNKLNNSKDAFDYLFRGLTISTEIGEKEGIATSLNNIGKVYFDQGDYEKAKDFYNRSLIQMESIGEVGKTTKILRNIGENYNELGDYNNAIAYNKRALNQAQEIRNIIEIKEAAHALYNSYKATGNPRKALEMLELYIAKKDSIDSQQNQREVIRQEYKSSYEKKAMADSLAFVREQLIKDASIQVRDAQLEKSKIQQIALYGCLALTLLFLMYVYSRYRLLRRQKRIISKQNEDITSAMEQLKQSKTQYKGLFSSLPDALLVFDYDDKGIINDCNDVAVSLLGKKSKNELIGHSLFEISSKRQLGHKNPINLKEDKVKKLSPTQTSSFEFNIDNADGSKSPVLVSMCVIEVKGRNQVFALLRDISDIKIYQKELETSKTDLESTLSKLQDTLKELKISKDKLSEVNKWLEDKVTERTLELEIANKKLIGLDKAKSQFINIISHEIRTPLNGIIGGLSLLKDSKLSEEASSLIEILDLSASRLNDFSKKALDISLINVYNKDILKPEKVKVRDIIEKTVHKVTLEKNEKEVTFKTEFNTDIDTIVVDSNYFGKSLFHIIHNAMKYSPNKGTVSVLVDDHDHNLVITVKDEGDGFEKGFTITNNVTFSNKNHIDDNPGLGLYLANQIIEIHGGHMENGNNDDKGAFVKIYIPTT
ncbi:tetratricopeptide repeat protein [Aquimarina rubra]|uniref:histidine kinase n=1 Tax=Aquimarina rubra TaxID=1920033 RepID=A0ABW5LIW8_9FLAO